MMFLPASCEQLIIQLMLFLLQLDFRRHRRHGHIGDALAGLARDGGQ